MIGVAIIGYGYWGPQIARNFTMTLGARLLAICDASPAQQDLARSQHPGVHCVAGIDELLADDRIEAIVIATPVVSHHALARKCLAAGKHVLIEKPFAASSDQARDLIACAAHHRRVLMVDHTYLYSGAVQAIQASLKNKELGEVYYYDSVRINLGRFRADVDVMWDLASHDLAIIDSLFAEPPTTVQATGLNPRPGEPCPLAYLTLRWGDKRIAQMHVSWLAPVKIRRTLIGGTAGMMVYDDLDPDTKLRIYAQGRPDTGTDDVSDEAPSHWRSGFRSGDMRAPLLSLEEPLHQLAGHFIACIVDGMSPISDGTSGLRVVTWLEAASQSLASGGVAVPLEAMPQQVAA